MLLKMQRTINKADFKNGYGLIKHFIWIIMAVLYIFNMFFTPNNLEDKSKIFEVLPGADYYEVLGGSPAIYAGYDAKTGNLKGFAAFADATGYSGPLTALVGINLQAEIVGVKIVAHKETPYYFALIAHKKFLESLSGKKANDGFKLNQSIDNVSGATVSAQAIISAVKKASHAIAVQQLGLNVPAEKKQVQFGIKEGILLATYGLILFGLWKKYLKLRYVTLAISTVVIGFWLNAAINITNIGSLLLGYFPSVFNDIFWYLLIGGTIILTFALNKHIYCIWLCPFLGIQELTAKIGGGNATCSYKVKKNLQQIKYLLTSAAIALVFIFNNPGIANYEPFAVMFAFQGSEIQWLILFIVIVVSLFFYRFWCQLFCPVGVVFETVLKLRGFFTGVFQGGYKWRRNSVFGKSASPD